MNNSVHVQYFLLGFVSTLLLSVWISFAPSIFNYTQSNNTPRPILISYRFSQISKLVSTSGKKMTREVNNVKQVIAYRYYSLGLTCNDINECQDSINRIKSNASLETDRLKLLAFDLVGYQKRIYTQNLIAVASVADESIRDNANTAVLGAHTDSNEFIDQVYDGTYGYLDNITFGVLSSVKY